MAATSPLSGVRVLDLSRVLAGPLCAALLGDLGADVTKVEMPGTGDDSRHFAPHVKGESSYFMLLNRGKRGITLNLKSEQGRELLHRLVRGADVLVENFRPGVTARLGIDQETLAAVNPRLVYVSISGFGQTGPLAHRPAYDHIIQAMGGIMSLTGWPGTGPTRVGESIGDVVAGMYGAYGALAALRQRDVTGVGGHVDVAMLDSVLSLLVVALSQLTADGTEPDRIGNRHPVSAPMDSFPARDGLVVLAVANDALFARLCAETGMPELLDDPRFATDAQRALHHAELRALIENWTRDRTVDEAVGRLEAAGVPAGPIWSLREALDSEHIRKRGLLDTAHHPVAGEVAVMRQPVRFSETVPPAPAPAPLLGQHTDEVLTGELGLSPEQIAGLRALGII
ncbi:CoA transferase [Streptomyces sp. NPDC048385]|uniref:CaiB/BaiF CoA transferase family protein n=1 Tax=Streptomyces sp. NPDC048385 TaxID=3155145 RepID=UPI00344341FA